MFETIRIILSLLPIVIQTVQQLEALFPEGGQGKMKFEMVTRVLQETYKVSNDILPTIEKMIPIVVDVFNKFGVFKK